MNTRFSNFLREPKNQSNIGNTGIRYINFFFKYISNSNVDETWYWNEK